MRKADHSSLYPVADYEEAVAVANDVGCGLSSSTVTQDRTGANRSAEDIEAGVVKIDKQTSGTELHVPFGGFKQSSSDTYREQGNEGLRVFTSTKTVYWNY